MPSENVIPFTAPGALATPPLPRLQKLLADTVCRIGPNQALLYRIASGDSNRIHVDPESVPLAADEGAARPLLHGLCTLGIAARVILQFMSDEVSENLSACNLEVKFVKPVFVGDTIRVQVWEVPPDKQGRTTTVAFRALNEKSGETVLDKGVMAFDSTFATARL
jgi:acyl dehydratase